MGADLYIEKIHDPLRTKYEPLFDAAVHKRDALPLNTRKPDPGTAAMKAGIVEIMGDDEDGIAATLEDFGL